MKPMHTYVLGLDLRMVGIVQSLLCGMGNELQRLVTLGIAYCKECWRSRVSSQIKQRPTADVSSSLCSKYAGDTRTAHKGIR